MLCPYHPSSYLVEDRRAGDLICTECGLVVGDRVVDVDQHWPLTQDTALVDHQYEPSSCSAGEIAERLCLSPSVSSQASLLLKEFGVGKSREASAAACLFIACRLAGVSRSFREICSASNVSRKKAGKEFKRIQCHVKRRSPSVSVFVERCCSSLRLSYSTVKRANQLSLLVKDSGRSAKSIAAASVWLAMDKNTSVDDIARVIGSSKSSLRTCAKMILMSQVHSD